MSIIINLLIVVVVLLMALAFLFIFYKYIYSNYKRDTSNSEFSDLMEVLNIIVHTEIDIYEKNVFDTKAAITPQNFENYYNDIVKNIIKSLSPKFFVKMNQYITEDALISYICRIVKEYLSGKVNGSI